MTITRTDSEAFHHDCARVAVEQFHTLLEAKIMANENRQDYNQHSPHYSLGYLTPDEFMLN